MVMRLGDIEAMVIWKLSKLYKLNIKLSIFVIFKNGPCRTVGTYMINTKYYMAYFIFAKNIFAVLNP